MNKSLSGIVCFFMTTLTFLCFSDPVIARVEVEILKHVTLTETPKDIVLSLDGAKAYILCNKKLLVYSINKNKVIENIELNENFSQITLSPNGETLFLTNSEKKQLTIIKISQIFNIPISDSPIIGNINAKVNIYAFIDYQCPYCNRVFPLLEQLLKKYPNDVNIIIKHFPLRMHKFAVKASMAALSASKQGKYLEVTKILLKNYNKLNDTTINQYAEEVGLDMEKFKHDIADPFFKKKIQQDVKLGQHVKVRGVPAIFINGRLIKNRSINSLTSIIEKELKKEFKNKPDK